MNSIRESLAQGDRADRPLAAADAATCDRQRVLLLEDDPSFRGIIRDCLAESGYAVVAVQNGGEGVREVMAGDFALVLCDMMMPGLRGDMFYRAVERIRPNLCQRFVFMSGHHNDAGMDQFLKTVNGVLLRKPFPLKSLLDVIALAEVQRTFPSLFEQMPGGHGLSQGSQAAADLPRAGLSQPRQSEVDEKVAQILARFKNLPAPSPKPSVPEVSEPEPPARGMFQSVGLAALALALVLVAGLWRPYWSARDRIEAASTERLTLEEELTGTSRKLAEAVAARSRIEEVQRQLAAISADRAEPRWSSALRGVAACTGVGIELREVRAHEKGGDAKTWTLVVGGIALGAVPRTVAEGFRVRLQRELDGVFRGAVSIQFTRFENLPDLPSALPGERRGVFTVVATIGFAGKTSVEGKDEA